MVKNDIESRNIQVNGRRAHYLKAGSGPPVVLIHGGASDSQDWISTMTALSNRFSFYALDLLGYGKSEKDENGFYLAEFAEYLAGFVDTLKLKNPALVGHSLGGRFCLDVAIKDQSKISKLVLIDTTGLGNMSLFGNVLQFLFWLYRKITRQPQPFPTFLTKPGEKFHHNYTKELRRLNIPTLLIWKELDPYLPVRIGRRAVKKIPGAKLAVLKGYGHAPHQKDKDRKAFYKILADFLDNG
jgi:pimeloyl-ACP methyl ester carboxylesterase